MTLASELDRYVSACALPCFQHDHLGSTVLTTGVNASKQYYAYGGSRGGSVPTDWQYTGQEGDGTGLVYLHARYYDPATGQFLSPDTLVPEVENVYAYNRYMYGYGNPLRYTDPTGHCVFGLDTIVCVIAAFAAAGGVAGFGGSVVGQGIEQWDDGESWKEYRESLDLSWTEAGIAGAAGAVGAGAAPVTGPLAYVAINALAGAGQKVATDVYVDGDSMSDSLSDPWTFAAAGISVAGEVIGGGPASSSITHVTASIGEAITFATGPYAAAVGGDLFVERTEAMLTQQQIREASGLRGLAAGMIANLPLPEWMTSWLLGKGEAEEVSE